MKYMLIPFMLIACGDKEEDSASPEVEEVEEEQEQENEDTASEEAG